MSDDSRASIHEGKQTRGSTFTSEYAVARGEHAGIARVEMPDTIEGPNPISLSGKPYKFVENKNYEAFPPEENGQGVIFHRTRPNISGWYGTGNAMVDTEALAGAVNQSIKHTGMVPKRDTTLSKDSGAAVANFIGKPEIKADSDFIDNLSDDDRKDFGAHTALGSTGYADSMLGSSNGPVHTWKGHDALRRATAEEKAATRTTLRELPQYKKIYSAMEEGRQWDPNSISALRNRSVKEVTPEPVKTRVNPLQLELGL